MNEEQDKHEDSLLDSVKAAGSSLGGLFGEFTGAYRKDREGGAEESGSHAMPDPVEEKETTMEQLRAAGKDARRTFNEGSGFGAVKDAAGNFAGHAEGIVRDVAGSVAAAADATKESGAVGEVQKNVGGAFGKVRDSVEGAFGKVRGRFDRDEENAEDSAGSEEEGNAVIIDGEVISAETTEKPIDKPENN